LITKADPDAWKLVRLGAHKPPKTPKSPNPPDSSCRFAGSGYAHLVFHCFQLVKNGGLLALGELNGPTGDNTTRRLPERGLQMQSLALLDPAKTGNQAKDLDQKLRHLVIGQDEAVHQIIRAYQTCLAGLYPVGRPIGNFLFLGPTGSGKTRTVEATAEALIGNPHAVTRIDCAEFQHSHEIAKLIGSPPGYLGHRETHPLLTQEALDQHHTDTVNRNRSLKFAQDRVAAR
jgi:hypothetical protein